MPLQYPHISPVPWISDAELANQFPNYQSALTKIEIILTAAQANGLTDQEAAAMLASFHARAVARLKPNDQQLDFVTDVFRRAVVDLLNADDTQ